MGSEGPECGNAFSCFHTHGLAQHLLGDLRRGIAEQTVLFLGEGAVDHIVPFSELGKQLGDFFGGMLEIVVHGDDDRMRSRPDAAQQGIVLAVIAHHADSLAARVLGGQLAKKRPAVVRAAVVHQNNFEARRDHFHHTGKAFDEDRKR